MNSLLSLTEEDMKKMRIESPHQKLLLKLLKALTETDFARFVADDVEALEVICVFSTVFI